jgi:nitroreductase/dihydropteridine reductase
MNVIESLNWRYATKKMNGKKVDNDKVEKIVEAAYLAPTSSGLQPFEIIVIENQELKQKIQPIAYGQSQIVDSSHLLVFASWDKYTEDRIEEIFKISSEVRNIPFENFTDYINTLKSNYLNIPDQEAYHHTAKQAYIGFGTAILQAAELQVDATPMEGFNNAELDKLLELDKKGLKSVTLLALGYREAENDWLVNMKKVRRNKEKFISYIR